MGNNPHYYGNPNYQYPPSELKSRTKSWNTNNNNNHTIKNLENKTNITAVLKHNSKGSVTYLTENSFSVNPTQTFSESRGNIVSTIQHHQNNDFTSTANSNVNVQQLRQTFMQRPLSKSTPLEAKSKNHSSGTLV